MENISIAKRTTDLGIDKNKAKLQNLGQTSAWFCLEKEPEVHVTTLFNKFDNSTSAWRICVNSAYSHAGVT